MTLTVCLEQDLEPTLLALEHYRYLTLFRTEVEDPLDNIHSRTAWHEGGMTGEGRDGQTGGERWRGSFE